MTDVGDMRILSRFSRMGGFPHAQSTRITGGSSGYSSAGTPLTDHTLRRAT